MITKELKIGTHLRKYSKKQVIFELTRSYRSTKEIIEFANEIIKNAEIPVGLATPVFRSGEDVKSNPCRRSIH